MSMPSFFQMTAGLAPLSSALLAAYKWKKRKMQKNFLISKSERSELAMRRRFFFFENSSIVSFQILLVSKCWERSSLTWSHTLTHVCVCVCVCKQREYNEKKERKNFSPQSNSDWSDLDRKKRRNTIIMSIFEAQLLGNSSCPRAMFLGVVLKTRKYN